MVLALAAGRGSALLVDGVSGIGKSSLLGEFARRASQAEPGREKCRVITTHCHPGIGPGLMYGPVVDVLLKLGAQAEQRSGLRRLFGGAGRGVSTSAPELLSALVPGLGAVLTIGREVTEAALNSGSMPFDSLLPFQQGAAAQIVDSLIDQARSGPPVILVIDDVQNIDPSSLLVLDRLLRAIPGEPISLVLSHATGEAADAGAASVEQLLRRWESESLIRCRSLDGLPDDAVDELVRSRHPLAPPALSARLNLLTAGHPIFVQLCLDEWNPADGDQVILPESLSRVVEDRMRRLDDGDRELLITAATQGAVFLSRPVAEAVGAPHPRVMERLRRIAGARQLISPAEPPAWAQAEASDCYQFEHRALRQVLYTQQSPQQRRSRHARIAAALSAEGPHSTLLERRLEIAHHLDQGGYECLAASARAHYALARSAAIDGLSFAEAERHCEKAISAARSLPRSEPGRDRQLVEAIELLLSLTEVRWRGQHGPEGVPGIDELAAEAEEAAERCQAPELIARTTLLRGKTLLATQGLMPALDKLREAVGIAERQNDPVALFVAKVEYGRQASKRKLSEGLEQLTEAERLYASEPRLGGSGDPVLQHARNLNEMQLGITLFDHGRLADALGRLQRCTDRLREEPLHAELPIALNYLAQVQIGIGRFQAAATVLEEAREMESARGGDSGWHAYNTALLAHLRAKDPGGRDESLRLIEEAWLETERTWLINLVPIVRNVYAQVLLDTAQGSATSRSGAEALAASDRLASETVVETRRTGMLRSEIAALSLRGRIKLRQSETADAADFARQAVQLLDQSGDMPALRSEEVFYHAARSLAAVGADAEAMALLEQAREKVAEKAGSLNNDEMRREFMEEPLNLAITLGELGEPGQLGGG